MGEIKHCTKCHGFAWWDGDFCCVKRMSIMEGAQDGKFWAILPDAFDANKCEDYDFNENYNSDVHEYYPQYVKFLRHWISKGCSREDVMGDYFNEDFLIKKYGYKHYKKENDEAHNISENS